ncbi:M48 family metalloprotease [Nonomuraea typhae]|uniref:M48 family metalloprotease n=1 Tax=Nonomuraea typhae TaxID=2603600 RepID=UPI0012F958AB|nr:M48 family metalloprotease [Nonomuraea typhae]
MSDLSIIISPPASAVRRGNGRGAARPGTPELQGVAALTRLLLRAPGAAHAGPVLITLHSELPEGGISYIDRCSGATRIQLDSGMLADLEAPELYGVLAHEVAHQVLGHSTRPRPWLRAAQCLAALAALSLPTAITFAWWWPWATLAGLATLASLMEAAQARQEEISADVLACQLLNHIGADGYAITTATLQAKAADPVWVKISSWIISRYPSRHTRLRAVATASSLDQAVEARR